LAAAYGGQGHGDVDPKRRPASRPKRIMTGFDVYRPTLIGTGTSRSGCRRFLKLFDRRVRKPGSHVLHVLSRGFVPVRFFLRPGEPLWKQLLPFCQQLLKGTRQQCSEGPDTRRTKRAAAWLCLRSGGLMVLVEKLTA